MQSEFLFFSGVFCHFFGSFLCLFSLWLGFSFYFSFGDCFSVSLGFRFDRRCSSSWSCPTSRT